MAPKAKGPKSKQLLSPPHDEATPDWPPIQHPPRYDPLALHALLPDQVLTIPQFWEPSLCKTYVAFLSSLPLTTTPGKPKRGDAVRVNDRYQIDDPRFAELLYSSTSLKELVESPTVDGVQLSGDAKRELWGGNVLGLNSNIRIYRYTKGQFFDQHCEWIPPAASFVFVAVEAKCRFR
jgi:hypothetical protein